MKILLFIIFGLLTTYASAGRVQRHAGASCVTPLAVVGTCVSLKFCPEILTLYQKLGTNDATRYSKRLRQLCGLAISDNYPVVCCLNVVYTTDMTDMMTNANAMNSTTITTTTTAATTTTTAAVETTTTTSTVAVETTTTSTIMSTSLDDLIKSDAINATTATSQCRGVCKPLAECNSLYTALRNDRNNDTLHKALQASNRICTGLGRTAVCCPDETNSNEPPRDRLSSTVRLPNEEDGCGFVRLTANKVVGGEESQPGAWPWMTLIGYNRYSSQPFKCGGSLISASHVLTAAHCIRGDLSFVRLGEHDVTDLTDVTHVDIDVKRIMQHPNYATRTNTGRRYDLAILYLIRSVEFTDRIKPICMPLSQELRARNYVGSLPYVAGWGRTSEDGPTSNVLQELQIPIVGNAECEQLYKAAGGLRSADQFDASVLCAGQVVNADSCKGDSGGPLMIPHLYKQIVRYYQVGIVSYGIGCAQGIPGVYTSTQYYLDWIEEMVANS